MNFNRRFNIKFVTRPVIDKTYEMMFYRSTKNESPKGPRNVGFYEFIISKRRLFLDIFVKNLVKK